jgi:hypothetical protein
MLRLVSSRTKAFIARFLGSKSRLGSVDLLLIKRLFAVSMGVTHFTAVEARNRLAISLTFLKRKATLCAPLILYRRESRSRPLPVLPTGGVVTRA